MEQKRKSLAALDFRTLHRTKSAVVGVLDEADVSPVVRAMVIDELNRLGKLIAEAKAGVEFGSFPANKSRRDSFGPVKRQKKGLDRI